MKIIACPDSFKGTLSSEQICGLLEFINGDLDALVDALTVADQARRLQEGE